MRDRSDIPEMGGRQIGRHLEAWAAECASNIVEVGCWLGAGTAFLAAGAARSGARVHTYDKWRARPSEVAKAGAQGLTIHSGQDTLPLVRTLLAEFQNIDFHKGDIRACTWCGDPIGLYVDDAAKLEETFSHVRRTFWPSLEAGAVLVMMDYHYYERTGNRHRSQVDYIGPNPDFKLIHDRIEGTSAAAFRYEP